MTNTVVLRSVPILGWAFLLYGVFRAARHRPLRNPVLRALWWIDAFLSVVVHTAQIPAAVRQGDRLGHSRIRTALLTLVFGLTWWKTQPDLHEETR